MLIANAEDLEDTVFKPFDRAKLKMEKPLDEDADSITAGRLYHAPQDKFSILGVLIEVDGESPVIYADLDLNGTLVEAERFEMEREPGTSNAWRVTLNVPFQGVLYNTFPLYLEYLKNVATEEMTDADRLVMQSTEAYARGKVAVKDKEILVQYAYKPKAKKLSPTTGWLGVDADGDGEIDMDGLSPEAAKANDETIVFRAGQIYLSTKRADLEKNQITMREHQASDYKRRELRMGEEVPDFQFTDFEGKKRKFSEFRGKYVLLDFWGSWCPPCRREMPYLKAAHSRFNARDFEIVGMNTDDSPEMLKPALKKFGATWTQAKLESIRDVIQSFRINSFPTTLLIDDKGKIVSMGRAHKGQPRLRGEDLLKTLDKILPE